MTGDMPPPPRRPAGTNWLRVGGVIAAFSAPISGFVLYALVAVLVGEDQLEDRDGLTGLGWSMFVLPVVVGLGLLAISFTGQTGPSRQVVGMVLGGFAVCCLLGGLAALFTADAGDASIGGGLLILTGFALGVAGLLVRRQSPRL